MYSDHKAKPVVRSSSKVYFLTKEEANYETSLTAFSGDRCLAILTQILCWWQARLLLKRDIYWDGTKNHKDSRIRFPIQYKKVKYYCYHDSVTCGLIRFSCQLSINTRHMFMAIAAHWLCLHSSRWPPVLRFITDSKFKCTSF